jgi:hypothetical protein
MFEGGAHQLYELIIPEGAHPPYLLPRQDDRFFVLNGR